MKLLVILIRYGVKNLDFLPKIFLNFNFYTKIDFLCKFSIFQNSIFSKNLDFFLLAHLNFQLLNHPEFGCIEKIKTISTTFMAASGLNGEVVGNTHVVAVAKFAIALLNKLEHINEHSFNHFKLRIGKIFMFSA
jgi:hypothetical protein